MDFGSPWCIGCVANTHNNDWGEKKQNKKKQKVFSGIWGIGGVANTWQKEMKRILVDKVYWQCHQYPLGY